MKSAAPISRSKAARWPRRLCSALRRRWITLRRIVAAVLVWCWWFVYRIGVWAIQALGWLWRGGVRASTWLAFHIGAPALCFVCIYLGVMSTLALPAALWSGLLPRLGVPALLDFPLASLPDPASISGALLTAIPLALAVFKRHHLSWCVSPDPLLARMLFAAYAGVSWPSAWFNS